MPAAQPWIVHHQARNVHRNSNRAHPIKQGLLDGQAYTLEEVGHNMGVTRERVQQIEAQALSRLRHPSIRRKLRDYLGE